MNLNFNLEKFKSSKDFDFLTRYYKVEYFLDDSSHKIQKRIFINEVENKKVMPPNAVMPVTTGRSITLVAS